MILRFPSPPLQGAATLSKNGKQRIGGGGALFSLFSQNNCMRTTQRNTVNAFVCGARAAELLFSTYTQLSHPLFLSGSLLFRFVCSEKSIQWPRRYTERTRKATPESEFSPRPGKSHTIASELLSLSQVHDAKNRRRASLYYFLGECVCRNNTYFEKSSSKRALIKNGLSLKDWRVILIPCF